MAHRKRLQKQPKAPSPPTFREKITRGLHLFIRENVRAKLVFAGVATLAQAIIPWTNEAVDRIPFIIFGSIFLGLSVPRRLWR